VVKRFVQATFVSGLGSVGVALAGFVRGKVLAVALGPLGLGAVAQMTTLVNMLASTATLGLGIGATRSIAGAVDPASARVSRVVVWRSAKIIAGGALGLGVLVALLRRPIATWTIGVNGDPLLVLLAAAAIPVAAFSPMLVAYYQGKQAVRTVAVLTATQAAALAVFTVIGVLLLGRVGAVAALPVVYGIVALWAWRTLRGAPADSVAPDAVRRETRMMLRVGLLSFLVGNSSLLTDYVIRSRMSLTLGVDQTGLYVAVTSVSNQYLSLLFGGLTNYVFPRVTGLAARREHGAVAHEMRTAVVGVVGLTVPAILLFILLRDVVVRLLYSGAFSSAAALVPIVGFGDYWRAAAWAAGVALIPLGMERLWARIALGAVAVNLVTGLALIRMIGVRGAAVAYAVMWFVSAVATIMALGRKPELKLDATALQTTIAGALVVGVTSYTASQGMIWPGAVLLGLWCVAGSRVAFRLWRVSEAV
jgi:PST family polysaccharide transporter